MPGFGWNVEYRAGPWGTDTNEAFDQVTLGLYIYPPCIRGREQWWQRMIKGGEER